jgi:hypothetical protein
LDQGNCHESVALTSKGWFKHNSRSALAAIKHAEKRPIAVKTAVCGSDSTLAAPAATKKVKAANKLPQRNKSRLGKQAAPCFIALLSRN